jgi:hypothetical protein
MDRVKYQALPTGKDVPAKVNIWGREVKKGTSPVPGTDFLYRLLSPSRSTDEQEGLPADLDRMLTIWNANHPGAEYWPERPRPYFQHRGERYYFSADQYTAYLKASGERALEVLGKRKLNFDEPTDRDIERVRQALGDARARAARGAKREVIRDNASSR